MEIRSPHAVCSSCEEQLSIGHGVVNINRLMGIARMIIYIVNRAPSQKGHLVEDL